jgi:tetratricopeptide (TPR) repeat protein
MRWLIVGLNKIKACINFFIYFLLINSVTFSVTFCTTTKDLEEKYISEKTSAEMEEQDKRMMAVQHFKEAESYFRKGNLSQAEDKVKAVLSLDSNHPVPHLLLGDIYFEKGDFQKAFDEYQVAHVLDKSKGLPHAKMGKVYIKLGKKKKALDAFQSAIDLDPNIPGLREELDALLNEMNLQAASYQNRQAATLYKKTSTKTFHAVDGHTRKMPERLDPRVKKILELGDEFFKDGLFALAIQEYQIAAQLAPFSVIIHQKLGDTYSRKGMLDEAIASYQKVKVLTPDSPLGFLGLGVVHARMFDIDKAISLFEEGIARDPNFSPLYFELGLAYLKTDRLGEAIIELEKTVALEPGKILPRKVLNAAKQEKEAEEGFETFENSRLILKYDPKQDQLFIEDILKSLNKAYEQLTTHFSYQPEQKIIVKVYPDLKEFQLAATTPQWFRGGVAATKDYKILLATPKKERNINKLPEVITHELTHAFTNLITYGNYPIWILEGLALYEASQWDLGNEKILRSAVSSNQLYMLNELREPFTKFKNQRRIALAYSESYTAVKFILDIYGRDKLIQLLHEFSRGKNFDEGAKYVLKISSSEFEQKWLESIKESYR